MFRKGEQRFCKKHLIDNRFVTRMFSRMKEKLYRQGVAAFIVNPDNLLLACSRDKYDSNDWQIPQGGIERGEDSQTACFREVEEETGLKSLKVISFTTKTIKYEWPPEHLRNDTPYLGQEHVYYLLRATCLNELQETRSFKKYKWASFEFLMSEVINFKKIPYREAWDELSLKL